MNLENINKVYYMKKNLQVLKDISVSFKKGKFYAIMGASGSGKTTLINILGLLISYTSGTYTIDGINVSNMSNNDKDVFRGKNIGFIFQSFYLNERLTALENVLIATFINKELNRKERKQVARNILIKLGLKDRLNHYPSQLSGGEQQRVAIARALVNDPMIILADEPTGNLDEKNEKEIFNILKEISTSDKIVIVVSHNPIIKRYCDVLYTMNKGILKEVKHDF